MTALNSVTLEGVYAWVRTNGMIPVSGLFRRMIRLVHDLSTKAGKKVDLQLFGEETEVDRTVIETITDPLVHLLRNALDHGLESPVDRSKAGNRKRGP